MENVKFSYVNLLLQMENSFVIRNSSIADLPEIVEIYNLSIPGRLATADTEPVTVESRMDWFHSHKENRPLFVVEESGKVVAFLSFKSFYGRPAYSITAEIGIYIHPDYQKKGLGNILLQKAIDISPDLKLENLLGFIFGHNEPSIKLFKKFGFAEWGTLPGLAKMDGKYVDLIIFGKKI
jgi:L-amino acid N-acyltransferase YncA